jgi:hypothetical protein
MLGLLLVLGAANSAAYLVAGLKRSCWTTGLVIDPLAPIIREIEPAMEVGDKNRMQRLGGGREMGGLSHLFSTFDFRLLNLGCTNMVGLVHGIHWQCGRKAKDRLFLLWLD